MTYTANLNLKKPDTTDAVNVADINDNSEALDIAVFSKVDKITGKELSTNDYDNAEKQKVTDAYTDKHTHSNKTVLNKFSEVDSSAAYNGTKLQSILTFDAEPTAGSLNPVTSGGLYTVIGDVNTAISQINQIIGA